ncbi:hypothetical protein AMAG_02486 [Allomyces macrogynus ATCC 38327]|uniref:Uncharacterized protein n=1 Tax=Allomyces macrogynus (strain ATCC 38327) TaxID=578462 RepID=A0A0L0S2V8_ALLM3|nr:hypothetical protein AMAG_02486 [Allomyces macrogynus ATCC 38327]|eukprot:KNE56704.1 hypothetical protein AMAG_02486 [Allomyces macrogynus ATCC 38327]
MTASGPVTIKSGIFRQPRIHGKPGTGQQAKMWTAGANPVRKPKGTRKRTTVHQTVVVNKIGAAPRKRKTTAELLRDRINALPVGSPLRVTYERRLARLQAAKTGGAAGQRPKTWSAGIPKLGRKPGKIVRKPKKVRKTVVVVKKHGGAPRKRKTTAELLRDRINALPVGSPLRVTYERRLARLNKAKTATLSTPLTQPKLMSLAGSGYDYASFDDAWDETYDDMWEDNYDEGFSVSEDAAYEGDDMWEDMYDDEGFSLEDSYDEDAVADDEYDGGDFSVSEDAYDGGDFSVEDSYDEDAADDDAYDSGDFSVEDSYDEDAADDEY